MKYLGWLAVLIIILGGGWWFVSKGNGSTGANDTGPIKIGVIAPLTGDAASYGEPMQQTVQMAIDEINAAGAVSTVVKLSRSLKTVNVMVPQQ